MKNDVIEILLHCLFAVIQGERGDERGVERELKLARTGIDKAIARAKKFRTRKMRPSIHEPSLN